MRQTYARVDGQVRRFRERMELRGVAPVKVENAAARYEKWRRRMADLEAMARLTSDSLGRLSVIHRGRLMLYVRALYGVGRKSEGEECDRGLISVAAGRVRAGLDRETMVAVTHALWMKVSGRLPPEPAELDRLVGEEIVRQDSQVVESEGVMNETETSVRASHGIQEPESGKAASVPVDELRERVVRYFTGKLEPGQNPEALADELVQAIASAEATGKRKKPKLEASARERHKVLSGAREVSDATPADRFTRQRALRMLREALALHQPVVKKCVAERLCNHKSFQQLAEDLNLSLDEVKDILAKLRGWVHKFTTYFENDWYWVETGKSYILPQH